MDHKRLKGAEYKAMIRKKREREREDPAKNTEFRLRGEKVEGSKIIRFQERQKIDLQDEISEIPKFSIVYSKMTSSVNVSQRRLQI